MQGKYKKLDQERKGRGKNRAKTRYARFYAAHAAFIRSMSNWRFRASAARHPPASGFSSAIAGSRAGAYFGGNGRKNTVSGDLTVEKAPQIRLDHFVGGGDGATGPGSLDSSRR
jgi:hypothetical protein